MLPDYHICIRELSSNLSSLSSCFSHMTSQVTNVTEKILGLSQDS